MVSWPWRGLLSREVSCVPDEAESVSYIIASNPNNRLSWFLLFPHFIGEETKGWRDQGTYPNCGANMWESRDSGPSDPKAHG